MSAFQQKVLKVVAKIPKGQTLTYKEVARRAGSPNAYRAVGNILSKNRDYAKIPCYRVIRSDGQIGNSNRGKWWKKMILRKEGAI